MTLQKFSFVSIIIPVYNGEKTIVRCVESLLRQDYPRERYEIIVVDNFSKDRTAELLQSYAVGSRIRVLSETQILNAEGARNTGIRAAKGDILAFTDADCVAEPNWLSELVCGHEDPRVGSFIGEILPLEPHTVIERYRGVVFLSQRKDEGKVVPGCRTGNCAFRRTMLDEVGLFDVSAVAGADFGLFWRGHRQGWKHIVNYDAVIYHKNYSTLGELWRQSLRYGGGLKYRIPLYANEQDLPNLYPPTLLGTLKRSSLLFGSFIKRALCHVLGKKRAQSDPELYTFWPLLEIVTGLGTYMGYRRDRRSFR